MSVTFSKTQFFNTYPTTWNINLMFYNEYTVSNNLFGSHMDTKYEGWMCVCVCACLLVTKRNSNRQRKESQRLMLYFIITFNLLKFYTKFGQTAFELLLQIVNIQKTLSIRIIKQSITLLTTIFKIKKALPSTIVLLLYIQTFFIFLI